MNYLLDAIQVGNYSSGDRLVRGIILCDTAADLPAVNAFANMELTIGSEATDISTGDRYLMDSSGTWHLQPSPTTTQLDLSNYYTQTQTDAAISTALTGYYTDTQTDAAIAAALTDCFTFSTSPASISDNTDLNDLPPGVYAKASNVSSLSNLPTGFASAFYLVVKLVFVGNTWRRQMLMYPTSNTGTYNTILCFRRTENGTQGNFGPWVRFDGGTVL